MHLYSFRYLEYGRGGHYAAWHTDAEPGGTSESDYRELAAVLLLGNNSDFSGGEFMAVSAGSVHGVNFRPGEMVIFPADQLWHSVLRVKEGVRRSLVFWISRPQGP